jgi:RNA polymerase sigma-70 factor (family 1)
MGLEPVENDVWIWVKVQEDEEWAFKSLFDKYYPALCDYSSLYVKNRGVAKEIVADVFFKLWQQRKSIEIKSSLKSYLFTSVRNHSINQLKGQKLKIAPLGAYTETANTGSPDGEKILLYNELENVVEDAINALPERQKEVFKMSRIYGMDYKQISETLSISVHTVQEHVVNAMKNMRAHMKKYVLLK